MQSKNGALLTKIAAIIDFVIAGLILLIGLLAVLGTALYQGAPINLVLVILAVSLVVFVIGMLLWNAAKKMQNSKTVRNGAIWAIVLGVFTMSAFSGVLALIGGIIGLIDSDKKR